jgi:hypothetical protein
MTDEPTDNIGNHTLRLLQEIREEMREGFEKTAADLGELKLDAKEAGLRLAQIETRLGRQGSDLEKIRKHLGLVEA